MKNTVLAFCLIAFMALISSCDKKNEDLIEPISTDDFPQVILLADEGDGDLEDEDKFSFKITLADRKDPDGDELGGKIIPLKQAVTVQFEITDFEGFSKLEDYIKDAEAFYEIDDCTTSLDQGNDLNLVFDPRTGKGSVQFPAEVEEIEIEFDTDEDLFDDSDFNTDKRSITIQLTGIISTDPKVEVNKTGEFTYSVQDDEGIYGEWQLDVTNSTEFNNFKELFGLINEDIKNLDAADVEEITLVFEFEEVKAIVVLKETEQVNDCGSIDTENKIIEIEAEIEELTDEELEGDVEFGEVLELDGTFKEYVYKGTFEITGKKLMITLQGEFGDDETDEITLNLDK